MLKKIILFDFDGTLADSLMMLVNFTNRYAGKFGFKGIPLDDLDSMRDLSANDLRKYLGASLLHIILLAPKYKKQLSSSVPGLHLFDGMKSLFRQLKENEHMLGIVTFNSKKNVVSFLDTHQITSFFEFIRTPGVLTGKAGILRKTAESYLSKGYKLIYIGDEVMDVEATRKAGIPMIAVTWGYNSRKSLEKASPEYIADYPEDILKIIDQI